MNSNKLPMHICIDMSKAFGTMCNTIDHSIHLTKLNYENILFVVHVKANNVVFNSNKSNITFLKTEVLQGSFLFVMILTT